jgi:anti-sigma regulatory factor (Ser/Thr protein kinase)
MNSDRAPSGGRTQDDDGVLRRELPADWTSASLARQAVREALATWAIDDPDRDAELLASELVTNASLHAPGSPIGFAVRLDLRDGGKRGVTCEVTDRSPTAPKLRQARADQEHGRGMAIVNALAAATGVQVGPTGKTTWFTLALHDRVNRVARQAELDPEAGS